MAQSLQSFEIISHRLSRLPSSKIILHLFIKHTCTRTLTNTHTHTHTHTGDCSVRCGEPKHSLVTAKVVLPKSGPADHFWSPKLVRPDHFWSPKMVRPDNYCPPKVVLPCQKRSAIRSLSNNTCKVCPSFFFQLATYNVMIVSFFRGATYTCK